MRLNFEKGHSIALMIKELVRVKELIFFKPALTTTLPAQLSLKFDRQLFLSLFKGIKIIFLIKFYNEINFERIKINLKLQKIKFNFRRYD